MMKHPTAQQNLFFLLERIARALEENNEIERAYLQRLEQYEPYYEHIEENDNFPEGQG